MRILAAHYLSGKVFLKDYREEARLLWHPADAEWTVGDELVLDIRFPELPSRFLVHVRVAAKVEGGKGILLAFSEEDEATRDFVVAVARGADIGAAIARKSARFPLELPAEVRHRAAVPGARPIATTTEDLSTGGAFVRTKTPSPVGTPVALVLTPPGHDAVTIPGTVAWIREDEGEAGMGIRFDEASPEEGQRLRDLLRQLHETIPIGVR